MHDSNKLGSALPSLGTAGLSGNSDVAIVWAYRYCSSAVLGASAPLPRQEGTTVPLYCVVPLKKVREYCKGQNCGLLSPTVSPSPTAPVPGKAPTRNPLEDPRLALAI